MGELSRKLNASGLHPSTRVLVWMLLAAAASWASPSGLLVASLMALAAAPRPSLFRLLVRSRWLLISLTLIFGLGTPGEPLAPGLGAMSPTWEGLNAGALHAGRLVFIMATLTLLVTSMRPEALLAGIYTCLRPLHVFGLPAERFAARLWLTLEYAQSAAKPVRLRDRLEQGLAGEPPAASAVTLVIPPFGSSDGVFVVIAAALIGVLLI